MIGFYFFIFPHGILDLENAFSHLRTFLFIYPLYYRQYVNETNVMTVLLKKKNMKLCTKCPCKLDKYNEIGKSTPKKYKYSYLLLDIQHILSSEVQFIDHLDSA